MQLGSQRALFAVTMTVSFGIAIFFSLYSLIPLTRTSFPGESSLLLGVLMTLAIGVQALTPLVIRRFSLRVALNLAIILLGVGAFLATITDALSLLLVASALVGTGFGLLVVAGVQGVALVTTPARLGAMLSLYGLITMASTAVGSPLGVQLALSLPRPVFGIVTMLLALIAVVVSLGIPAATGRGAGSTDEAESTDMGAEAGHRRFSQKWRSALDGLPWLVITLMMLAMLMLSQALSGLPTAAIAYASAALIVFAAQAGNAVGRGIASAVETKLSARGAQFAAALLTIVGGVLGAFIATPAAALTAAALVGIGVGVMQTVSLHVLMLSLPAGKASVTWNLALDSGLWIGGMLWGLALAHEVFVPGVLALCILLLGTGIALMARSKSTPRQQLVLSEVASGETQHN